MPDLILTLNAGSSTLKAGVFEITPDGAAEVERRTLETAEGGAEAALLDWAEAARPGGRLVALGHRVVHGGTDFAEPVRLDEAILAALDRLCPLAPLHQPRSLAAVRAMAALRPDLPQVACFDTAFHRTQPAVAA